jgi:uncharacterized protein
MRTLPFAAVAALFASLAPTVATAAFTCSGAGAATFKTVCADPELVRLDRAVDAALARGLAVADPLTAMLLKRDQRWFSELLGGQNIGPFDGPDDSTRKQMLEALQGRSAALERVNTGVVDNPAGQWANVFNTAKVKQLSDGALRVEVMLNAGSADSDDARTCGATADVKRDADGWFAGPAIRIDAHDAAADKDSAATPDISQFRLRLRLQANTLRIVVMPSEQDTFCQTPEQITGSYFAIGPSSNARPSPAALAARTVAPSFACASAKNTDEEEICADPELAARDADIARAYREALRRLDARSVAFLRDDQRAYVKENADAVDQQLYPGWDKQASDVPHTGNARNELYLRLSERLAMLANLDPARQGTAGLWVGHNAMLAIVPAADKTGTLHAAGKKWQTGDYKAHCDFEADGRMRAGVFRTEDSFPALAREGATLTIDAGDPDQTRDREGNRKREQPDYCTRMDSAKARLFPVKAGAAIGMSDGRIR